MRCYGFQIRFFPLFRLNVCICLEINNVDSGKLTRELLSLWPTLSTVGGAIPLGYFPPVPGLRTGLRSPNPATSHRTLKQGWSIVIRLGLGMASGDKAQNPQVAGGCWIKGYLTFYDGSFFASGFVPQGRCLVFKITAV